MSSTRHKKNKKIKKLSNSKDSLASQSSSESVVLETLLATHQPQQNTIERGRTRERVVQDDKTEHSDQASFLSNISSSDVSQVIQASHLNQSHVLPSTTTTTSQLDVFLSSESSPSHSVDAVVTANTTFQLPNEASHLVHSPSAHSFFKDSIGSPIKLPQPLQPKLDISNVQDSHRSVLEFKKSLSDVESVLNQQKSQWMTDALYRATSPSHSNLLLTPRHSSTIAPPSSLSHPQLDAFEQSLLKIESNLDLKLKSAVSPSQPTSVTAETVTHMSPAIKDYVDSQLTRLQQEMQQDKVRESMRQESHYKELISTLESQVHALTARITLLENTPAQTPPPPQRSDTTSSPKYDNMFIQVESRMNELQASMSGLKQALSHKLDSSDFDHKTTRLKGTLDSIQTTVRDLMNQHDIHSSDSMPSSPTMVPLDSSSKKEVSRLTDRLSKLEEAVSLDINQLKSYIESEFKTRKSFQTELRKKIEDLVHSNHLPFNKVSDFIKNENHAMESLLVKRMELLDGKVEKTREKLNGFMSETLQHQNNKHVLEKVVKEDVGIRVHDIENKLKQSFGELEERIESVRSLMNQHYRDQQEAQQAHLHNSEDKIHLASKQKEIWQEIVKMKDRYHQLHSTLQGKIDTTVIEELMRHIATRDELKRIITKAIDSKMNKNTTEKLDKLSIQFKSIERLVHSVQKQVDMTSIESIKQTLVSMSQQLDQKFNDFAMDWINTWEHESDDEDGKAAPSNAEKKDRLYQLIQSRIDMILDQKASILNRYTNDQLEAYYEQVAERTSHKLTREFDEKLYLVCSDLSSCKTAWQMAQHRPLQQCALWLWRGTPLKMGSAIPWNIETLNTNPDNFKWESDSIFIRIQEAGLYEISFAFFTKSKPSIQLIVNGESVMSAINASSYIVHHGSGFVVSGEGRMEPGSVTGLSLLDFLALPPKSTLTLHYHGKKNHMGHGFLQLRKVS